MVDLLNCGTVCENSFLQKLFKLVVFWNAPLKLKLHRMEIESGFQKNQC